MKQQPEKALKVPVWPTHRRLGDVGMIGGESETQGFGTVGVADKNGVTQWEPMRYRKKRTKLPRSGFKRPRRKKSE